MQSRCASQISDDLRQSHPRAISDFEKENFKQNKPVKTGKGCCKGWTVSCSEGCPAWLPTMVDYMTINIDLMHRGVVDISPATAIPISAARMVECGVLMMSGAELERAAPVLPFADRGFGERNLVNTFLKPGSAFNAKESLGWFDIVDEKKVEKGCVRDNLHQGQEAFCVWELNHNFSCVPTLRPPCQNGTLSPRVFTLLRSV